MAMLYLDEDILVNILPHSLMKKLGLNCLGQNCWSNILIQLVDLPKLQAPNCAKGMLNNKSQMSSWNDCTGKG